MLGTLKAHYFGKIHGGRLWPRIDFKPMCFQIGSLVPQLWPKEEKMAGSKRLEGEVFRKFHCSGRNPQKNGFRGILRHTRPITYESLMTAKSAHLLSLPLVPFSI